MTESIDRAVLKLWPRRVSGTPDMLGCQLCDAAATYYLAEQAYRHLPDCVIPPLIEKHHWYDEELGHDRLVKYTYVDPATGDLVTVEGPASGSTISEDGTASDPRVRELSRIAAASVVWVVIRSYGNRDVEGVYSTLPAEYEWSDSGLGFWENNSRSEPLSATRHVVDEPREALSRS